MVSPEDETRQGNLFLDLIGLETVVGRKKHSNRLSMSPGTLTHTYHDVYLALQTPNRVSIKQLVDNPLKADRSPVSEFTKSNENT